MDISIIIPAYNAERTIRVCVLSILNSDFNRKFEVIVVDDGSTDDSLGQIKDLDVRIISQENRGAAAAKNTGAKNAKSDLILFVDSDVVFFEDTLRRIYEHLKRADVDYVSVIYSKKPANQKWIHKYKALADYCYYYDMLFAERTKMGLIKDAFTNGGTDGYKKSIFLKYGGFDENIRGAGVEREQLLSKLRNDNCNAVVDGNIRTKHHFPDFIPLVKNYFYRTVHSMRLLVKHDYQVPCLKKNTVRIALAPLMLISVIVSIALFAAWDQIFPFFISLLLLMVYVSLHSNLYRSAYQEYGFLFAGYTFILNVFFSTLIGVAGLIGTIKSLV